MADAIGPKKANLETVVRRARDVLASRQKTLDTALLKAKTASEVLALAENGTTGALRAMKKVSSSISGDAELKGAMTALLAMEATLQMDIENVGRVQGWLAPFETYTADSLRALDSFTLATLENYLGKPISESHGKLSPLRNESRVFSFTKPPRAQAREDLLASMEIEDPDADVDGMSVETILSTTFGPLRSAAAILGVGMTYATQAVSEIGTAAEIMDSSAKLYQKVYDSIEGNGGHAKIAKKTLEQLIDRLSLESASARTMLGMSEDVTATVARVLESIDAFAVNALRSAIYGTVPEEAQHSEDVVFTPGPVALEDPEVAAFGRQDAPAATTASLADALDGEVDKPRSEELTEPKAIHGISVDECVGRVADGEVDLASSFLIANGTGHAIEIISKLDALAVIGDETKGMNAVKALKAIAAGDHGEEITGEAFSKLQMISLGDLGAVSQQATACMSELGAMED